MKAVNSLIFLLLFFVIMTSCKQGNSPVALSEYYTFDTTVNVSAEHIKINEIIKPVDLTMMRDYIVVANEPQNGEDVFNVYGREKMNFLYGFGTHGRGPLEYISFTTPQHAEDNILPVYNNVTNTLVFYEIKDDSSFVLRTKNIRRKTVGPVQCMAIVNDSVMLYSVHNQSDTKTYSHNINTNKTIDAVDFITPYRGDFNTGMEGYMFDYKDGMLVMAFEYVDEVVRVDLNNDYTFSEHKVHLKNYSGSWTPQRDISSNTAYYTYPYIGDNYIYIERIGRPMKELNPFQFGEILNST